MTEPTNRDREMAEDILTPYLGLPTTVPRINPDDEAVGYGNLFFNTNIGKKLVEFNCGWDGDSGRISLDHLLEEAKKHFPNIALSKLAITISQESSIILFEKD